jgi:hypothetical protein
MLAGISNVFFSIFLWIYYSGFGHVVDILKQHSTYAHKVVCDLFLYRLKYSIY